MAGLKVERAVRSGSPDDVLVLNRNPPAAGHGVSLVPDHRTGIGDTESIEHQVQPFVFVLVDVADKRTVVVEQYFPAANPVLHHGEPARMLVRVLVQETAGLRVVGWIDVNAAYFSAVRCGQQAQRLGVVTMNQQTVEHLIQVTHTADHAIYEAGREVPGVDYERRVSLQKRDPSIVPVAVAEQAGGVLVDVQQLLPLRPLRVAAGDVGIPAPIDGADGYAVPGLRDELALLPQHLLKALDLIQEVDDAAAHRLEHAHDLKPAVGQLLAGGLHLVEIEHLVLEIEVEFLSQEPPQVFVNEEVGRVAPRVAPQVVLKNADRPALAVAVAVAVTLGRQRRHRRVGAVQPPGNLGQGGADDRFLLSRAAVDGLLPAGQRPVLERDEHPARFRIPVDRLEPRQEEPLVALDVVLLHVRVLHREAHGDAVPGKGVVTKVLVGLDVVLVAVRPVQIHLLAVVGDGVALALRVAPLGDEVPVLIVAAEEGVQMVVDGRLYRFRAAAAGPLRPLVLSSQRGVLKPD